jgi:hypothetical protein
MIEWPPSRLGSAWHGLAPRGMAWQGKDANGVGAAIRVWSPLFLRKIANSAEIVKMYIFTIDSPLAKE